MDVCLSHVGINAGSEAEAQSIAALFHLLFGMETRNRRNQIFMDSCIEIMKTPGPGEKGHLAFKVHDLEAAVADMKAAGIEFAEENFKYDEKGGLSAAYLRDEIAGFAIHLI